MYLLGFLVAPVVALLLKRTLLRGETPVFVMEMPAYKRPSVGTILRRMIEAGWEFTKRAGTLILATMILVWALLYFPRGDVGDGRTYDEAIAEKSERLDALKEKLPKAEEEGKEPEVPEELKPVKAEADGLEEEINRLNAEWKAQSVLGRMGKAIEPAVRPLGWDWKIGMAALASFPAREVVAGTLGIIYGLGEVDTEEIRSSNSVADTPLGKALADAEFEDGPRKGEKVFTPATAVSLMVFFALCAQCASTLAVIRRETGDWRWAAFTFFYMTALAYVGALVAYQVGVIVESWRVAS
jgi:ferrous iron transport protein B